MDKPSSLIGGSRPGRMMVAVVLGTALSAMAGTAEASAAARTVQDLSRYCTACWRNARLPADRWDDCTQEVLVRLLERVPSGAWGRSLTAEGEERREFLRAIDAVKKRIQRGRKFAHYPEDAVADARPANESARREAREQLDAAADEVLGDRQQQILRLTMEGWSVPEIAAELDTTADRVSDEKYKAIRKLRAYLADRDEIA